MGVFTQIVYVWVSFLVSLIFAESGTTSVSHGPSHSLAAMSFPCTPLPALSQISEAGREGRDEKTLIKANPDHLILCCTDLLQTP